MNREQENKRQMMAERHRLAVERARRRYERSGFTVHRGGGTHEASGDLDGIKPLPDLVACRGPSHNREIRFVFIAKASPDPRELRITGACRALARGRPDLHVDVFPYAPGMLASPPAAESVTRLINEARQALDATPVAALQTAWKATEQALFRMTVAQGESYEKAPQLDRSLVSDLQFSYVPDSDLAQLRRFVDEYERVVVEGEPGPVALDLVKWAIEFAKTANEEAPPPVDDIVDWFLEHYEQPAEAELPIDVETGSYVWLTDGPCDARSVLAEQFPAAWASSLDDATRIIEADGVLRWVPRGGEADEANDTSGGQQCRARECDNAIADNEPQMVNHAARSKLKEASVAASSPHGVLPSNDPLGLASRHHLEQWASREDAPTVFPELIRRLILESTTDTSVDMPSGRGVLQPGWDGIVNRPNHSRETGWVPEGRSVWELSTAANARDKATRDYRKRAKTHRDDLSFRMATAYVAVSLRPWDQRRDWATKRQTKRDWRDVRSFGLNDIIAWLQQAPATLVWLSDYLGLTPHGFESGWARWKRCLRETGGVLDQSVILAGRSFEADRLRRHIEHSGDPGSDGLAATIAIEGDSVEDVCDFVCATLAERSADLDRVLFVNDETAWNRLLYEPGHLVLIPQTNLLAAKTTSNIRSLRHQIGHQIVVPVDRSNTSETTLKINPLASSESRIRLPKLDSLQTASALKSKGISYSEAQCLGWLARRSYPAFRREFLKMPAVSTPAWAEMLKEPNTHTKVVAIVLANAWDESNEYDRQAVAELISSDASYDDLEGCLTALTTGDDPLLNRTGSHLAVAAPADAWHTTTEGRLVGGRALHRLSDVFTRVLGHNKDRSSDTEQQVLPALCSETQDHSPELRKGLARTLALLGSHGLGTTLAEHGNDGAYYADLQVRTLLQPPPTHKLSGAHSATGTSAAGVMERLCDLSDILPLLGEAAPDVLLDALQQVLDREPEAVRELLRDSDYLSFSRNTRSPRHGTIWALERIAWSPDHLSRTADTLWRLHQEDPGSRMANGPLTTLRAIFWLGWPQTGVDPKERWQVLSSLVDRYPATAADLLPVLIPRPRASSFPIERPQFRDWPTESGPLSASKISESQSEIAHLAIMATSIINDAERALAPLLALVNRANYLSQADRQNLWDAIEDWADREDVDAETARQASNQLDKIIRVHRTHTGSAAWSSLPSQELDHLEAIVKDWALQDPVEAASWLFADYFPNSEHKPSAGSDWKSYDVWLDNQRATAVKQVLASDGLRGVQRLAVKAGPHFSYLVGRALAIACRDSDEARTTDNTDGQPSNVDLALADGLGWSALDPHTDMGQAEQASMKKRMASVSYAPTSIPRSGMSQAESGMSQAELSHVEMFRVYIYERFIQAGDEGWLWLTNLREATNRSPAHQAALIAATLDHPRDWQEADALGAAVADEYWRLFRPRGLGDEFAHAKLAAQRLTSVGCHTAAITVLASYATGASSDAEYGLTALEALEGLDDDTCLAVGACGADASMLAYHIQELFTLLSEIWPVTKETINDNIAIRIAEQEFRFLELLTHDREPRQLHARLALDPEFFVDCIKAVYRPQSHQVTDGPEAIRNRSDSERQKSKGLATACYRLLSSWKQAPGQTVSGEINAAELKRWVLQAYGRLAEADRVRAGTGHIGEVLGAARSLDEAGLPEAIRDLLEELHSDDIDLGVCRGILNARGVTCRTSGDGGAQERKLVDRLQSEARQIAAGWPRTARILRLVAESYDQEARIWDLEDERFLIGDD